MTSSVTCQQKRNFHNIDRQVYARLVIEIGLDLFTSKKIVAFWFWIEREGCRDFIMNLRFLVAPILSTFAMETITCLDVIYSVNFVGINRDIPFMRCLVGQGFFLEAVYEKREKAKIAMERFIREVCDDVFSDIFPICIAREVKVEEFVPCNAVEDFLPCKEESDRSYSPSSDDIRQNLVLDSKNERTLFTTFSKGHPISKQELRHLITRKFGNCVEAIYQRDRPPPLFARVVLKSASAMARILGDNDLVKLQVNGKHAWVRRFTPKQNKLQSLAS